MDRASGTVVPDRLLPQVYGAALAAAADQDAAARAAEHAMVSEAAGVVVGTTPAAAAILAAIRDAPSQPFASLPRPERETLALARLGGLNVPEIAAALGEDERTVKRRLLDGLTALRGRTLAFDA
jgi:DNA-directed RNA polymerase specialized sigma24 family protein